MRCDERNIASTCSLRKNGAETEQDSSARLGTNQEASQGAQETSGAPSPPTTSTAATRSTLSRTRTPETTIGHVQQQRRSKPLPSYSPDPENPAKRRRSDHDNSPNHVALDENAADWGRGPIMLSCQNVAEARPPPVHLQYNSDISIEPVHNDIVEKLFIPSQLRENANTEQADEQSSPAVNYPALFIFFGAPRPTQHSAIH